MNIHGAPANPPRLTGAFLPAPVRLPECAGTVAALRSGEAEEQRLAAQYRRQEQAASDHILVLTVAYANCV
jgi:hypothetical protein